MPCLAPTGLQKVKITEMSDLHATCFIKLLVVEGKSLGKLKSILNTRCQNSLYCNADGQPVRRGAHLDHSTWSFLVGSTPFWGASPRLLWMDEILHHPRNPGIDNSPVNTNKQWFQPWFLRWCEMDVASIHSSIHFASGVAIGLFGRAALGPLNMEGVTPRLPVVAPFSL